jgi:putative ABC transport system substrate-binding protein
MGQTKKSTHGRRFDFLGLVVAAIVAMLTFSPAMGQTTKPVAIGLSVWSGYPRSIAGFKEAMVEGGYVEGETVTYLHRNSGANKKRQRSIAEEFRDKGVDLVYSLTTPGTIIVKEVLPDTTPIVFSIVTYPADSGLIESFEYSGNNLVGTSNYVPIKNYVDLLRTILPQARVVAIFGSSTFQVDLMISGSGAPIR